MTRRRSHGESGARNAAGLMTAVAAFLLAFVSSTLAGSGGLWTAGDTYMTLPAAVLLTLAALMLRRALRVSRLRSEADVPLVVAPASAEPPALAAAPAQVPAKTRTTKAAPALPGRPVIAVPRPAVTVPRPVIAVPRPIIEGPRGSGPRRDTPPRPVNQLFPAPADRAADTTARKADTSTT